MSVRPADECFANEQQTVILQSCLSKFFDVLWRNIIPFHRAHNCYMQTKTLHSLGSSCRFLMFFKYFITRFSPIE